MTSKVNEAITCPNCQLKVADPELIRCPRCNNLLFTMQCQGNCRSCKQANKCQS